MTADDSTRPLTDRWRAVMVDTYGTPPPALVRRRGSTVRPAPALTVTDHQVDALMRALPEILDA
ncbi:4-aminobutyrate aminotransferase-like enzyme [Streptomyces sp. V4I23]|uniref:hypothetical protein n=1 Tax=Streptomyces sp. V4I23 TaxID=3042282 RepID=UPI0027855FC5|nr:hypothetical protein [Streptomyces sp. V4I23]MDQ1006728.1 4-aminobutyrate aminotransferase-like enzyme [Streptomyces sp. V4I23]